ncbi:unnamed protein product (macronuclear) [Paramecium tetraurelia]|uniref:Transmembrane protein n=1 Tax=Paramecium tetraurelia TaxID=5888 RepID=A0BKV8_PARTE|nr:uncharacterized protein GSPATT00029806001 [Paramecium tetraurelia]CAK59175.1 unnamed protein product [Paramecium tetraurelia]|eukprot:XP_001426573.1 hypothetical protein (macronuclear) [Paramecium tetraurelia strain d4-2]
MRIKQIFLYFIAILVFGQEKEYCQMENTLLTIASGENYDLHLFDYIYADDLTYKMTTYSNQQSDIPFTHLIRKTRQGVVEDEVIEILENLIEQNEGPFYCFLKSTKDEQIVYSLVKCQFVSEKIIYTEVQFFIKREHCYQIISNKMQYFIMCKNDITNQLEIYMYLGDTKKIFNILISDVIIPQGSKVKAKKQELYDYLGVLIYKGRMENNKYISESSSLYIFKYIQPMQYYYLLKQYEAHSQSDDFITDFDLFKDLVFITRFKGGLTYRNLKIAWSEEINVTNAVAELFGIHTVKISTVHQIEQYQILLMFWGENFLIFANFRLNKLYNLELKANFQIFQEKRYNLKSEKVFNRNVVSTQNYLIFSNDKEFQAFYIKQEKDYGIVLVYQVHFQTLSYMRNLQLPKIELVNLTEIQNPQLIQISAQTSDHQFDKFKCQDIKIYYQVQLLESTKIWPKFYNEKEKNVFILKYNKNELKIQVDLSKVFSGSALSIEEINLINKEAKFIPSYQDMTFQFDLDILFFQTDIPEFAILCYFLFNPTQYYLIAKIKQYLFIKECEFQSIYKCRNIKILNFENDNLQDLSCQENELSGAFLYIEKMKHGFVGEQISLFYIHKVNGQIDVSLEDFYTYTKGSILSIVLMANLQAFTILRDNVYTLNTRTIGSSGDSKVTSIELHCQKLFELVTGIEIYENLLFVPSIKWKNFVYQIIIEIYNVKNIEGEMNFFGSLLVGVTKKPTKERLQVQLSNKGIFILSVCDISEDEQTKKLLFIEKTIFLKKFLYKNTDQLDIKNLRTKIYPTFQLKKIQKIKTTQNFLYVYGSEIDTPSCIYIYRIYANQMDILYHVIRQNMPSIQIYTAITIRAYDYLIISSNQLTFLLLHPIQTLQLTKSNLIKESNLNDDEVINIKMKTLIPKSNNKIHEFQIKLTCTDCKSVDNQI